MGNSLKSLLTYLKPNPYVLVASAVAGLTFVVYKLATAEKAAEIAAKSLTEAHKERTAAIEEERSKTEELIRKLKDETLTRRERQTLLSELQKIPDLFNNLELKRQISGLNETIKLINEELEKKRRLQLQGEISTAEDF